MIDTMTTDEALKQANAIIDEWENEPLYEFKRSHLNGKYGTVSGFFASYILKADEKGCINEPGFLNERVPSNSRPIFLTCDHDFHQVIGIVRRIEDRKVGVFMIADFLSTPRAQEVRKLVQAGAVRQMSCIVDMEIDDTRKVILPDGTEATQRRNCDLIEITLTDKPAQPCSIITDFT